MIPILYANEEDVFENEGLGRIPCVSCVVEKERNSIPECEFQVAVSEPIFKSITEGCIIYTTHDATKAPQPFEIYGRSEELLGVVTFYARHISARLDKIPVNPYTATTVSQALSRIKSNSIIDNPFTFTTTKTTQANFNSKKPMTAKDLLGGVSGSILDVYGGGEYTFDHFSVKLDQHAGQDTKIEIRYGKNLLEYLHDYDESGIYNAVVPFWQNPQDATDIVVLDERIVRSEYTIARNALWTNEDGITITNEDDVDLEFEYAFTAAIPLDLTQYFDEKPTQAQLRSKAESLLASSQPWLPTDTVDVDFVALADMEGYQGIAPLERVLLYDTVNLAVPELGVYIEDIEIVKTRYNSLLEKYESMELGDTRATMNSIVKNQITEEINTSEKIVTTVDQYVQSATQLLTGAKGGHLLIALDEYGKPQEMFIMDTEDKDTAVHVWRYNLNGWGYSDNGIEGPYTIAATMNGVIVADLVRAGMLKGTNDNNYWNLDTGYIQFKSGKMADFTIESNKLTYENGSYKTELSGGYGLLCGESSIGYTSVERNFICFYGTNLYNESTPAYITYSRSDKELYMQSLDPSTSYILGYVSLKNDSEFCGYNTAKLGTTYGSYYVKALQNKLQLYGNTEVTGNFTVSGTKSREIYTKDYADRLLYCYETTSPTFGDIGEGIVGKDGICYIWLDPIFVEAVSLKKYQVFLQAYGEGTVYVTERTEKYFKVQGTAGMAFGWEVKAKQAGFENYRLDRKIEIMTESKFVDYGQLAINHIKEIEQERGIIDG